MKKFTKLLGIVLIIALVMSISISAFADVNITVNRDSTYAATADGDRGFTYKQIFHATKTATSTGSNTQPGYDSDGTPGTITYDPATGVGYSYYLLATETTQIGQLGTWDDTAKTWTKASGNNWFKLTKSGDGSRYIVEWDNTNIDTDTAQAAAAWLNTNYTAISSNTLTGNGSADKPATKWTAEVPEGYYLIVSSEGQNLVAATTDISIYEKNSYPKIDKQEKDEDQANAEATKGINDGSQISSKVAVGDVIDYTVTVTVPADANKPIIVTDTMTAGLTYDSTTGLTVKVGETALSKEGTAPDYVDVTADYEITVDGTAVKPYDSNATWQIAINPTTATKGKDVVITFKATVDADALTTDTTQRNDVDLKYDNTHYEMTDYVEYDVYATAIVKYDGDTATESNGVLTVKSPATKIKYLEGVTFKLQEKGTAVDATWTDVSVTKVGNYYRPLDTTAATAETAATSLSTNADGQIIIRGLDGDKSYQLVELTTLDGYNLMTEPAPLTLTQEKKTGTSVSLDTPPETQDEAVTYLLAAKVTKVPNNAGAVLPSTGGIGTTIFYVVGSILVVAAGVLLITKKRMSREG